MNNPKKFDKFNGKEMQRKAVLVLLAVLSAILISIFCALWIFNNTTQTTSIVSGDIFPGNGNAIQGHLPKMTKEEIKEQMQREADRSKFSFKINSRPSFENGEAAGTLQIENPNHNIYPFVVKIFLDETGEEIYDSGGILPNHHINTAKLTKILPKGNYNATAYIQVYDPDTNEYAGQSAVALVLTINS